jgi:hypothetical protein
MHAFEPSGTVRTFRSGGGEVTLWFPGGELVAGRVEGHVRGGLAIAAFREIDRHTASHPFPGRGFIDFSAMTAFEWDARMTLLRWNLAHRRQAQRLDLLSETWLAHMALRALGTILGDRLVSHENRVTFEAAYASALGRHAGVSGSIAS